MSDYNKRRKYRFVCEWCGAEKLGVKKQRLCSRSCVANQRQYEGNLMGNAEWRAMGHKARPKGLRKIPVGRFEMSVSA